MQFEMTLQANGMVTTTPIGELPVRIPVQFDDEDQAIHWLQKLGAKLIDESKRSWGDRTSGLYEVQREGTLCAVRHCENKAEEGAWIEYDTYCERPLPKGESKAFENVLFHLPLCDKHYRQLYIQPNEYPDAVSIPR